MIIGLYPLVGDLLHPGHLLAIREAKKHCDYLIVALNCKPEGKNPTQSIYERYLQISFLKDIDEVIPYEGKKDLELIASSLDYNIRFLGEDYINKEWDGKSQEEERGIKPFFLERKHSFSSTELKERIKRS